MHKIACLLILFLTFTTLSFTGQRSAWASFAQEFEEFNRRESVKVLDNLEKQIQTRVKEWKKEDVGRQKTDEEEIESLEKIIKSRQESASSDWSIRPSFTYQMMRDSNIYRRRNNPVAETEYIYIPSFTAVKRIDAWKYSSNYELAILEHRHFNRNDRMEHGWDQTLVRKGSKLSIALGNRFALQGFDTERDEDKSTWLKLNNLSADVSYKITPKTSVGAYYVNQYIDFKNTPTKTSGSLDHTLGVNFSYKLKPRLELFTDYSYRLSRPHKRFDDDNINIQNLSFGLQGQLTPKLFWNGSTGVESREFALGDDKLGFVFQGVMTYLYSPKTQFTLKVQRAQVPTDTLSSEDPLNQVIDLSVDYALSSKIHLLAGQGIRLMRSTSPTTVVDPENPDITTTKIPEEVLLNSSAAIQITPLRDLAILLVYDFERAISELQVGDYTNHKVMLEVKKKF